MRDFTPRAWDPAAQTLTLDFALHEKGPASEWARRSSIGDTLWIGGPRGSTIVPNDFDWYWLIGDATSFPSIGRRLAHLRAGVGVTVIGLIADQGERQTFATQTSFEVRWVESTGDVQGDALRMLEAVRHLPTPDGDGFVWIACEAFIARQLYNLVVDGLELPKQWVKAAGYCAQGRGDAGERIG
jgi:NADPH-dependent ferric siderophore reductase